MPSRSRPGKPRGKALRTLTLSGLLLGVLVAQEYALLGIPNVQLTVALLLIYAAVLPWGVLVPLTIAYVLLDNWIMGSLNIVYFVPMLAAWLLLVTVGKWLNKGPRWAMVLWATAFGFVYGWFFAIPQTFLLHVNLWAYLAADFPFEVIMAATNFASVAFLHPPLTSLLHSLLGRPGRETILPE